MHIFLLKSCRPEKQLYYLHEQIFSTLKSEDDAYVVENNSEVAAYTGICWGIT